MKTEPLSWDEFSAIAGPNAEAFAKSWEQKDLFNGSLCWPGLFIPFIWLLYRKLYFYAAGSVILFMVFNLFAGNPIVYLTGSTFVLLIICLNCFLFGEKLYIRAVASEVRLIETIAQNDAQRGAYLAKAAGVSRAGAIIGALITAVSLILIGLRIYILNLHG